MLDLASSVQEQSPRCCALTPAFAPETGRKLLGMDPWIVPGDKRPVPENDDTESDSDDDDDKAPLPETNDTEDKSEGDGEGHAGGTGERAAKRACIAPHDTAALPETNDTEDESEGDGECEAMHACTAPGVPIPH